MPTTSIAADLVGDQHLHRERTRGRARRTATCARARPAASTRSSPCSVGVDVGARRRIAGHPLTGTNGVGRTRLVSRRSSRLVSATAVTSLPAVGRHRLVEAAISATGASAATSARGPGTRYGARRRPGLRGLEQTPALGGEHVQVRAGGGRRHPAAARPVPAFHEAVDHRGDARPAHREPAGEHRRGPVALAQERQRSVLGEGRIASSPRAGFSTMRESRARDARGTPSHFGRHNS